MQTKKELLEKLDEQFKEIHISWRFIKRVIKDFIEKYSESTEKEEVWEINLQNSDYGQFVNDQQPLAILSTILERIGIVHESVSQQGPKLKILF